jgi:flagellar biosynthesis protein FlhF
MKIKKYIVNSIDEALSKIKKELGNDAYILTTKKIVTSGALNLSRKNMLEVTAAVDNKKNTDDIISKNLLDKRYGVGKK